MPVDQSDVTTESPRRGQLTDRELLRRFEVGHDEDAFATLLHRHGTMVLRVCQRILDRREDAEDAFQATFLVLAKKAGSVSWHESVAAWLHSAARRLASEVRRGKIRRQIRESRRQVGFSGDALDEVSSRELLTILDEELEALPEECRGPLLLCCMEGMSGDEAAQQLGCSPSTVKRRLREARELLHARLTRRGIALSVTALLTLIAAGTAAASLPPALASETLQAAALFKSGAALPAGLVSAQAVTLTRVLLPAASASLKLAAVVLLIGGLVVVGAVVSGRANLGGTAAPAGAGANLGGAADPAPFVGKPGVRATVETTLRTRGELIRQFALDADPNTFFGSVGKPGPDDHFTLVFDRPVAVNAVGVKTGMPDGGQGVAGGKLEVSADGKLFEPLAEFTAGAAGGDAGGRKLLAVRIRPGAQPHPLTVREFTIDSEPPVAAFRHPVEFAVDTTDAPEMAEWAEAAARTCERAYPMICDELAAEGYRPPTRVPFVIRRDAAALAAASDGRVVVSAGYFDANPHDVGAVIHATSFVVQAYRGRNVPMWLTQGIADYVRFFKFEPGVMGPLDPDSARYDGDSQATAAFLAYLVANYDAGLVRKLNAALREGRYADDIWGSLTGKPLSELGAEWRRSLRR